MTDEEIRRRYAASCPPHLRAMPWIAADTPRAMKAGFISAGLIASAVGAVAFAIIWVF